MLTMNNDIRTDAHSDAGSDIENTSNVADYRLDPNLSLTMSTPNHRGHRHFGMPDSDDSSCDGDVELSPVPKDKLKLEQHTDESQVLRSSARGMIVILFIFFKLESL